MGVFCLGEIHAALYCDKSTSVKKFRSLGTKEPYLSVSIAIVLGSVLHSPWLAPSPYQVVSSPRDLQRASVLLRNDMGKCERTGGGVKISKHDFRFCTGGMCGPQLASYVCKLEFLTGSNEWDLVSPF